MATSTSRAASALVPGLGTRGCLHALCRRLGRIGLGGLGLCGLGLRGLRLGGLRLGVRLGVFLLGSSLFLFRAVQVALVFLVRLEVGLVPARALEAEHRRGYELAQS